jgi:hypothetical protein
MSNKERYLYDVETRLSEACHIYVCARNQDAGLRDEKIEKTLRLALSKVSKQRLKIEKERMKKEKEQEKDKIKREKSKTIRKIKNKE